MPDGKTKYLSEVESGAEVLIVNKEGVSRQVVVGRSKIETRPLRLIKAEINGEHGSIILQNAETIRVVTKEGIIALGNRSKGWKRNPRPYVTTSWPPFWDGGG